MLKVPQILQDFSILLNPKNLKAFKKIELIKKSHSLVKAQCPSIPLSIQKKLSHGLSHTESSKAQFILRLYFYQIENLNPFSIDLRKSNFQYDKHWRFTSTRLSYTFNSNVLNALKKTYEKFFLTHLSIQEELLELGLLDSSWEDSDKDKLEQLFFEHFKSQDIRASYFKLEHLIHSFSLIFSFIVSKNKKVPSDFAFIGIYLTALYSSLNEQKEPINIEENYKYIKKNL
ncbi:MAG: hypothetical protein N4A33_04725 [Bacteriovoracaceae bacterium]|jgi:hypothetical protein|nr:hypothetical protein [Bacteriovoracaceae bacterium]